ncbi:unnamed protein product, partial [Callosobruchus maculatus]
VSGDPSGVVCPFGSFRCPEGKCIPSLWVCNYQKDCEKGEDEFQSCPPPECEPGQLTCRQYIWNKTYCFPPHYRCDMTVDCIDGSDETECSDNVDCWMEIQHGKGPWAPPVSGIVPLGSTLTLVVAINDYRGYLAKTDYQSPPTQP